MGVRSWWNPNAARQAMRQAGMQVVANAAEYMAQRAREYCPVDTGELQSSIIVISSDSTWYVQATAAHAVPVEMGHLTRDGGTWVPPNPFMRKAIADTKAAWQQFGNGVRLSAGAGGEHFLSTSIDA
jgi:hypothetical protein